MTSLDQSIHELNRAISQATAAKPGPSRAALNRRVLSLAAELEPHVDRLAAKLETQWQWFDDNPDDPKVDARTKAFIATLRTYEVVCDAINAVECLLASEAA